MKKFEFSMEKVLEMRRFEQKQAEIELGKANSEISRIQNELKKIAESHAKANSACSPEADIYSRYNLQNYVLLLEKKKETFLEELVQAQMVAEEKRKVVQKAMANVKVLEKLRENKFIQWKKETEKSQEEEIDDIVMSKISLSENS